MGPKKNMWTKELELTLICEIRNRPILWDVSHPKYSRNDIKNTEWDEVAAVLSTENFILSGSTVRDRFVNMRTTFMKNDKLIRESKSSGKGSDEIYKPKWPLFECLTFLRKSTIQATSISNLPSSFQSCSSSGRCDTQEVQLHSSEMSASLDLLARVSSVPIPTVTETYMASSSPEQLKTIATNISDNVCFDENLHTWVIIRKDTNDTSLISETSIIDEDSTSSQSMQNSNVPCLQQNASLSSPVETLSPSPPSLSAPPSSLRQQTQQKQAQEKKKVSSDSLYNKRGTTKKSRIDDAVQAIKELAQQDILLPERDSLELFGSFVASRLRGMNPEERQHREMLIFKALTDSLNYLPQN